MWRVVYRIVLLCVGFGFGWCPEAGIGHAKARATRALSSECRRCWLPFRAGSAVTSGTALSRPGNSGAGLLTLWTHYAAMAGLPGNRNPRFPAVVGWAYKLILWDTTIAVYADLCILFQRSLDAVLSLGMSAWLGLTPSFYMVLARPWKFSVCTRLNMAVASNLKQWAADWFNVDNYC